MLTYGLPSQQARFKAAFAITDQTVVVVGVACETEREAAPHPSEQPSRVHRVILLHPIYVIAVFFYAKRTCTVRRFHFVAGVEEDD